MASFVDDDDGFDGFDDGFDDDARGLVGWLSTRRKWKATTTVSTVSTNGGFGDDDGFDDDDDDACGVGRTTMTSKSSSWVRRLDDDDDDDDDDDATLRKRTDDAWFFKNDDDDGVAGVAGVDDTDDVDEGPLDGYHYRRVGLDAAERALDAELDAVERALADGGRGLDEAFGFAFASVSTRPDEGRDDDDDEEEDGNGVIDEPPKMWNARFVGDVLSTTPGRRARLDEVVEEEEEDEEEEETRDEWRFSPPPDAGVFAASIPVVSERVVEGETFTSRLDDILDRVDVARALAMEAKRQLFLNGK